MRLKKRLRFVRRKSPTVIKHYLEHKELARTLVHEKLVYWNQFYNLDYKRVFIKNQKTCWGSCSEHGNLNFNYRIIFLPQVLMDYVIVHELCHLMELNHSKVFWAHVEKTIPNHLERKSHLIKMTRIPQNGFSSSLYALNVR